VRAHWSRSVFEQPCASILHFYVFDMLAAGARDIRHLPLVERKQILRDSFENTPQLIYVVGNVGAGAWCSNRSRCMTCKAWSQSA
jgi:ATP-dependent DNA ligase